MTLVDSNINNAVKIHSPAYPTSYREIAIGRTLYQVTSVFKGEKPLAATLEKLAIQHVLDEMDGRTRELLRA